MIVSDHEGTQHIIEGGSVFLSKYEMAEGAMGWREEGGKEYGAGNSGNSTFKYQTQQPSGRDRVETVRYRTYMWLIEFKNEIPIWPALRLRRK